MGIDVLAAGGGLFTETTETHWHPLGDLHDMSLGTGSPMAAQAMKGSRADKTLGYIKGQRRWPWSGKL